MQIVEQQRLITQDQIITPLVTILDKVTPQSNTVNPDIIHNSSTSIKESLENLFPEQQHEEKNIKKTKEILGVVSDELSPEDLSDTIAKIQYLCESWLDSFEQGIFDGATLKELLHEKGSS